MDVCAGICTFFVRCSAVYTVMGILPFPFTCCGRGCGGGAGACLRVSAGRGLVHVHHRARCGILCVGRVRVAGVLGVVDGVRVLCGMGLHGRGYVRTLAVGWGAGGRLVEGGRGRGIWAAIDGVGGIHGGGGEGGGGGGGRASRTRIGLEMSGESRGVERLIADV